MREIEVGDTVRHVSGWTGKVVKIEGEMMGNRIIHVNDSQYLECVFVKEEDEEK